MSNKNTKPESVPVIGASEPVIIGERTSEERLASFNKALARACDENRMALHAEPYIMNGSIHARPVVVDLDAMKDEISDPNYFTMLRVTLDKFSDDPPSLLRADILNKFKVAHVDLRFQPVYDDTLNDRLSGYDPNVPLTVIDADIIKKYIAEQSSTIPHDLLENGLDLIKQYADNEADS